MIVINQIKNKIHHFKKYIFSYFYNEKYYDI